jgi:hypothetical protein
MASAVTVFVACSDTKPSRSGGDSSLPAASSNQLPTPAPVLSPDSGATVAIIDSLKLIAPPSQGEFDASQAPQFSVDRIMSFVSDSGLVLADVNRRDSIIQLGAEKVREQLARRSGRAFDQLVHVAWISSIPYPRTPKDASLGVEARLCEYG